MDLFSKIPTEMIYVAMAAVGGIARYLQSYLYEGDFAWQHFIAHIIVSAFSGYMFYQFAINILGLSTNVIPIIAGMGGWMGVEALKTIETFLKSRLKR